ncbi:hypothetical protein BDN72DRAFT_842247 [Pluteus cervinus]|uniref:Uncharacterized protein n=1 Tax=Pluteus cervinus TaxID=181527 RepID=A0ACD3AQX5_9AGAR|nr:hypothetical protein BDN72DRAFT_842247 [Pluteus cervinus]
MSTTTEEVITSSLAACMKFAKGPSPNDAYEARVWEMAGAHSFLLNALLHLYKTAGSIPSEKHCDFAEYALMWYAAVHHHHEWEESSYYPLFGPKFDTETIITEHQIFHDGVERLKDYLVSCIPAGTAWGFGQVSEHTNQVAFDAATFRALISDFAEPLGAHLQQELDYLEPAKLRASGLTEADVKHIGVMTATHMRSLPPTIFLVYVVLHVPKESGFPPAPGLLRNFVAPYVFWIPYRRLWQFAPQW